MEIKIGQKFFVIKNFVINGDYSTDICHKIGEICNVIKIYVEYQKYPVFVQFSDGTEEQYSYDEINEYFKNMAEWREKQIDEILND